MTECTYIPDDEGVVVLAAERGEVLLVERERETLNQNFVQLQSVLHHQRFEVPNDNVSLIT